MSVAKRIPRVILGTMTLGTPSDPNTVQPRITDPAIATAIVNKFASASGAALPELDSARMYCGGNTEVMLGQILHDRIKDFKIATKVPPPLTGSNIETSLKNSLEALKVSSVDIFYLHWPDHQNPISESLAAIDRLHKQGLFNEFGLSNYHAKDVEGIIAECKEKNYVLPTVYQGMYNAIARRVEQDLFDVLEKNGIRFYVYNPLAGGLLSGNYKFEEDPKEGRFSSETVWGKSYRQRYWNEQNFNAIQKIQAALDANGSIKMADASLRWVVHHSKINHNRGDGIIIGGSSLEQIEKNLDSVIGGGELPQDVVDAFDQAWSMTKDISPNYNR